MLLGVVLLIWGVVGYKILNTLSPDAPTQNQLKEISFEPKKIAEKDTFSILANYRDPFLGTLPKKKVVKRKSKPKVAAVPEPNIIYTGSVINNDKKNSIFFVTIDGNQFLMKTKQQKQKVTLLSGTETAIRVRINGKLKTIAIQQ